MPNRPDISDLSPRRLTVADASVAMELSSAEGWNQTEQDWKLMLEFGHGIGFVNERDRPVATCILIPYKMDVAWVGMMLVDHTRRGAGIGSRLMRLVVDVSLTPILGLDATEQGASLYGKLGFEGVEQIVRFRLKPSLQISSGPPPTEIESISPSDFDDYLALFEPDVDLDRRRVLARLTASDPGYLALIREGKCSALSVLRPGRTAAQVGPLYGTDAASASRLIQAVAARSAEPLIIDVPERHAAFVEQLSRFGFQPSRRFLRMYTGGLPLENRMEYAIAGPEFG
jgi:GNAT superfamily N-acetyltransferase